MCENVVKVGVDMKYGFENQNGLHFFVIEKTVRASIFIEYINNRLK